MIKKIKKKPTVKRRLMRRFINRTQHKSWSGFENVPTYFWFKYLNKAFSKGLIGTRSSALAFNFFLALFPAIIFLFTLIPYIPIAGFQDDLLSIIQDITPRTTYEAVHSTIEDIVKHQQGGLLSFGFITALYFASNGIESMIKAFHASATVSKHRKAWKTKIIATLLTLEIAILLLIAIALMGFSELLLSYLVRLEILQQDFIYYLLLIGRWVIIGALYFLSISTLYYFGPTIKNRFRFFSIGSTVASILIILLSLGFGYFVANFGSYNKVYGSIGTLIIMMLFTYFNSFILLIGFELNVSLEKAKAQIHRENLRRSKLVKSHPSNSLK